MIPLGVLLVTTIAARATGAAAWSALDGWGRAARLGLAVMLMVTASAHFGSRRKDLIRMVPPSLPRPELLVTVTGIAELLVSAGLLWPPTATAAAIALVVLLIVMFPANVHAARASVGIGGRRPTPLGARTLIQGLFAATAIAAALG